MGPGFSLLLIAQSARMLAQSGARGGYESIVMDRYGDEDTLAAATNSVIVTLPSFSAFASHLGSAQFDWLMLGLTSVTAVIGAWLGAKFMAKRVKSLTLSRIFAAALVLLAIQRVVILLTA